MCFTRVQAFNKSFSAEESPLCPPVIPMQPPSTQLQPTRAQVQINVMVQEVFTTLVS